MKEILIKIQLGILLAGTLFSWFTIYNDFKRFYAIYGTLTKISDCAIPNPITTPCFYGAIAFFIASVMAFKIYKRKEQTDVISANNIQNKLWYLLIAGTIFAWGNFGYEAYKFYSVTTTELKVSCSGIPTENVFLTPCFYGSVIFLGSLVVGTLIKMQVKRAK